MKRALIPICLVFILFSCFSCGRNLPEDYRSGAFSAELCYEINGLKTVCAVEYGACSESGGERDFSLRFIAPTELCFVGVIRSEGEYFMTCDGEKIPCRDTEGEALAKKALILSAEGERSFMGRGTDGGEILLYWSVATKNGDVSLVTDIQGVPISITQDDTCIKITRFNIR